MKLLFFISIFFFLNAKTIGFIYSQDNANHDKIETADKLFEAGRLLYAKPIYAKYFAELNEVQKLRYVQSVLGSDASQEEYKLIFDYLINIYEGGNKNVAAELGRLYFDGNGVAKDDKKALALIDEAVHQNSVLGLYNKGLYYDRNEDYTNALKYYTLAADKGYSMAMNNIGVYHESGKGTIKDPIAALAWYNKAAYLGNGLAFSNIAWCYFNGKGHELDRKKAYEYFHKAKYYGEGNHRYAMGLGHCYLMGYANTIMYDSAMHYYKIAAQNNNMAGYSRIGFLFEQGKGIDRNVDSALFYYSKAAEGYDTWALIHLAEMYKEGNLIEKNEEASWALIASAANMGNEQSNAQLAYNNRNQYGKISPFNRVAQLKKLSINGNGYATFFLGKIEDSLGNFLKATDYFEKAANQGNTSAMVKLYYLHTKMNRNSNNEIALNWLQKAVDRDDVNAMFVKGLDLLLLNDSIKAFEFLTKAANGGSMDAIDYLGLYHNIVNSQNPELNNQSFVDYTRDANEQSTYVSLKAEEGDAQAQYYMGKKYLHGIGVDINYSKAFTWFQLAASQDNSDGYLQLGLLYEYGIGVSQNYTEALIWYEKAAEKNHAVAINNIGSLYYNGKGVPKDIDKAAEYFKEAANSNLPLAKTNYAHYLIYNGKQNKADIEKGRNLMLQIAESGYSNAQTIIGKIYLQGEAGTVPDTVKAKYWLNKAADNGDAIALTGLATILGGDIRSSEEAKKIFMRSAKLGNARAIWVSTQLYNAGSEIPETVKKNSFLKLKRLASEGILDAKFELVFFYKLGIGTEVDILKSAAIAEQLYSEKYDNILEVDIGDIYSKGGKQYLQQYAKWYSIAANKGNSYAQHRMGLIYFDSVGTRRTDSITYHYFKAAVEQKFVRSYYYWAYLYKDGVWVSKDITEANKWFFIAAEAGSSSAQNELGGMYLMGLNIEKNGSKAMYWFEKAAAQDHPDGLNNLGECYYLGFGTKQDYKLAAKYYQMSVDKNSSVGNMSLGVLYLNGQGVPKDIQKAKQLFKVACEGGIPEACAELEKLAKESK